MVTKDSVEKQLKKLHFNANAWGRAEVNELSNILLDHEEIYELVNGVYDGGFALLVATNVRLLLVDKKPMNYLTVEDLRFDMINELDYSHRLVGARISISAGSKNLSFMSFNQQRLRKAISHVQRCMAESKKQITDHQEDQKQHLAQINQQLQAYLLAQHQQQDKLLAELEDVQKGNKAPEDIKFDTSSLRPSPELSDYLLARSLLSEAQTNLDAVSGDTDNSQPQSGDSRDSEAVAAIPAVATTPHSTLPPAPPAAEGGEPAGPLMADLYAAGMQEIYGRRDQNQPIHHQSQSAEVATTPEETPRGASLPQPKSFEINPLHVAYSKLPMALRNKKFGRPSFHAHSRSENGTLPNSPQKATY